MLVLATGPKTLARIVKMQLRREIGRRVFSC
jgi:hypothetical protein